MTEPIKELIDKVMAQVPGETVVDFEITYNVGKITFSIKKV